MFEIDLIKNYENPPLNDEWWKSSILFQALNDFNLATYSRHLYSVPANLPTNTLTDLLNRNGSDKAKDHRYDLFYIHLTELIKNINILVEIGIGSQKDFLHSSMPAGFQPGSSIYTWKEFFDPKLLVGLDIDSDIEINLPNYNFIYCDQLNEESIRKASRDLKLLGDADLIIDDGLHSSCSNLNSLLGFIDNLTENGFYIIEDISPDVIGLWQPTMEKLRDEIYCATIQFIGDEVHRNSNLLVFTKTQKQFSRLIERFTYT